MTSLTPQPGHTAPLPVITPNVAAGQTGPLPVTQASPDLPTPTIKKRKKRASGVASNVIQHVIAVCDTSGSMSGSKIDEVNLGRAALVKELEKPENKNGFRLSFIDFSSGARPLPSSGDVMNMTGLRIFSEKAWILKMIFSPKPIRKN